MKQTVVAGTETTVAEGHMKSPDGDVPIRVLIVTDASTGEQFHFPFPEDQANAVGDMLKGNKPEVGPDLLVPDREPTPQELEQLHKASSGEVPPIVGGS